MEASTRISKEGLAVQGMWISGKRSLCIYEAVR
jgi:hypothetical protein